MTQGEIPLNEDLQRTVRTLALKVASTPTYIDTRDFGIERGDPRECLPWPKVLQLFLFYDNWSGDFVDSRISYRSSSILPAWPQVLMTIEAARKSKLEPSEV